MGGDDEETVPTKVLGIPLESPFANEPDVNSVAPGEKWKYFLPNPEKGNEGWGDNLKSVVGMSAVTASVGLLKDGEERLEKLYTFTDWNKFSHQSFWGDIIVANKFREIRYNVMRIGMGNCGTDMFPCFHTQEEVENALVEVETYFLPYMNNNTTQK